MIAQKVRETIREVPDFPKQGIMFKDITPVLEDPKLCKEITDVLVDAFASTPIDAILGIETRGFFFGMLLAQSFNLPFIPVRKEGKLPHHTVSCSFELEYGEDTIEMHKDILAPDDNVLIHDDLLATGGTARAAAKLVQEQEANVSGFAFIVALDFLNGEEKIKEYSDNIFTLVNYQ